MVQVDPMRRSRWLPWLVLLALASACGPVDETPSPSGPIAPSTGADLQLRPVIEIVPRSSADWDQTELTCMHLDATFRDCVASTSDRPRIVLLGPGDADEKYVLGPLIVDANDVERAIARPDAQPGGGWSVYVDLTAEGTSAFESATEAAVGSPIAIVLDGLIVSSPVVATPITSGSVVLASELTEREARTLASQVHVV